MQDDALDTLNLVPNLSKFSVSNTHQGIPVQLFFHANPKSVNCFQRKFSTLSGKAFFLALQNILIV